MCPQIEHAAVLLASERHQPTTWVGCDESGIVDPDELLAVVSTNTSLTHLQWANHEVGSLQRISAARAICSSAGSLLHVYATAAVGHVPVDFGSSSIDLLSCGAHKFGGLMA